MTIESTFEHLINNIDEKINIIDNIYNLLINIINNIEDDNLILLKNIKQLQIDFDNFHKQKNEYNINTIIFISDYYSIKNNNNNNTLINNIYLQSNNKLNYNNIKKYTHDIECGLINTTDIDDIINIFIEHCYDFHIFNNYDNKISFRLIQRQSKNIFDQFGVFLLSSGFYDKLTGHIHNISKYIDQYKYLIDIDYLKKINKLLNLYDNTSLSLDISTINAENCICGKKMVVNPNTSEIICSSCGFVQVLIGTVFDNSQVYNQDGGRYKHANYDPNRHCKFWVDRLQAKENTVISKSDIDKINYCISRDNIKNKKNISIEQFRAYLKECKLSNLNDHLPLIKKIVTGYNPPQLTYNETQTLYNYFDKAIKTYDRIKPKDKKNFIYYPYLLLKLLDLIIEDKSRKRAFLCNIHLQGSDTLTYNDNNWFKICEFNKEFIYRPTERLY